MRRFGLIIFLAVLAGGAFFVSWSFLNGPHYSLYQIGKAVHERQPRLFLAYVDVDRILDNQKEDLVALFMPERPADERKEVTAVLGALVNAFSGQIKKRIAQAVSDPNRDNIPSSWTIVWAASVTTNGDNALVVMADPQSERKLRLGMRRDPEHGYWRVVEINARDLKALVEEYMARRKAS